MKFNAPKNDLSYMMGGKMKYQEGGEMPEQESGDNPMEERVAMLQEAMSPFSTDQQVQIMDKIIESVSKMAERAAGASQGPQGEQMQSAQPQQMR